jgi:hypothetical protein
MTDKQDRFRRHMEKFQRKLMARYLYARATVPTQARGVSLKLGNRWWLVTPGFPQDRSPWRVSYGDERGPIGHETATAQGRKYETKYEAIMDIMLPYRRARITGYVMPGGDHIQIPGVRNNPLRRIDRLLKRGQRGCPRRR